MSIPYTPEIEQLNGQADSTVPDWLQNAPNFDDEQEYKNSKLKTADLNSNQSDLQASQLNGSQPQNGDQAAKEIDITRFVGPSFKPSIPTLESPYIEPVDLMIIPEPLDVEIVIECMRTGGDYGDAILLTRLYQDRICFDHKAKAWHLWNGHYWIEDETNLVNLLIPNHVAAQYMLAGGAINQQISVEKDKNPYAELCPNADNLETALKDLVDQLYKHRKRLMYKSRRNDVLDQARSLLGISGNDWDKNGWILGCKNGVLQLKAGKVGFRNGKPSDYIKTIAQVDWQGLSLQPNRFESFLSEILEGATVHQEAVHYMQNLLGYSILGMAHENMFAILYGDRGQNGKGTLSRILSEVLGKQMCGTVSEDVFVAKRRGNSGSASPHLLDLRGMRLAWCAETNEGARLSEAQVKRLTGGENLKARGLFQKPVEWKPTHVLFLMTNDKPHVNAEDDAMWKRIALIPFLISFVANPVGKFQRLKDPDLVGKLTTEEGKGEVLGSLVKWCLRYQNERLILPESLQVEVEKYRTEEDTIGAFLADCCVISDDAKRCYEEKRQSRTKVKAQTLYKAYKEWFDENSSGRAMSNSAFGKKIKRRFYSKKTNKGRFYFGVEIKSADPSLLNNELS